MKGALGMTQEATGELIFYSICSHQRVQVEVNKKFISNLINQKANVHDAICSVLSNSKIIQETLDYFSSTIFPKVTIFALNDMHAQILDCLEQDISVSQDNIQHLNQWFLNKQFPEFLGQCFLYACSRPNKLSEFPPSTDDFPLLAEVSNECPICHKKLIQPIKGHSIKKYEIVQIFPDDLPEASQEEFRVALAPPTKLKALDNQIALCPDHAERYLLEPELDEYLQLSQLKKFFVQNDKAKQVLITLNLEEEISEIITALSELSTSEQLEPLSLNALKIKAKILPQYALLINNVQNHVLNYYQFINNLLEKVENYDLIASEIKKAFQKLNQSNLSQPEIFEELSEWMLHQTGLPDLSLEACKIVVSFFVQSCEVFYEISK
jgi:hypothetical protein